MVTAHIFIPHGSRRCACGAGFVGRAAALGACSLLVVGAIVAWFFSWSSPPVYTPGSPRALAAPISSSIHDERVSAIGDGPYTLAIDTPRGALLFFGARHLNDAADPQVEAIRSAWNAFRPTVALVEGRMGFFVGPDSFAVRQFGESAAVYALARDAGVPLYTLEPPYEKEVAALLEVGSPQRVALFVTLRGAMSDRRSGRVSDEQARNLLRRRTNTPALKGAFDSFKDMEAFYAKEFPGLPAWRDLAEEALWPSPEGTWLNAMARRAGAERDEHFAQVLLDLVAKGERVFAVAGRSHVVMLEPALWATLQPATRGELSSPRPWEK